MRNRVGSERTVWVAGLLLLAGAACDTNDGAADAGSDIPGDVAGDSGTEGAVDAADADAPADAADETGDAGSGCPRPGDPGPGSHTLSMEHDGLTRSYIAHVPPGYDPTAATPLVLNLHGYQSMAGQQVVFSDLNSTADARGFLVAYPDGYHNSWNGGTCCGDAASEGRDDVAFLRALVDELADRFCVDRDRVYAAGMSNGGFMSYRLACEAADLFAGFAPVAGGLGIPACTPTRPRRLIAFHGTEDSYVPFAFGEGSWRSYAAAAGCTGEPVRTPYGESYCDVFESCSAGVEVGFCALAGMDHCWPGGPAPRALCEAFIGAYSEDVNANELLWDFLDG